MSASFRMLGLGATMAIAGSLLGDTHSVTVQQGKGAPEPPAKPAKPPTTAELNGRPYRDHLILNA